MAKKLLIVLANTDPRNGEELGAPFFQASVAAAMDYEVEETEGLGMRTFAAIEADIDRVTGSEGAKLLSLGEEMLAQWLEAHGQVATEETSEGFRLLALQRQAARGDPSFNACRETCRELVFHYNLLTMQPDHVGTKQRMTMMRLVARHLCYFLAGKLENARLGEFCCSSKPLRLNLDANGDPDAHRTPLQPAR